MDPFPFFYVSSYLQTLTDEEFAMRWQDFNQPSFGQQFHGQNYSWNEDFDQELFYDQISEKDDPFQTLFDQELYNQQIRLQQMPVQQPNVEHAAGQETSGRMWTQQPLPHEMHVNVQRMFIQQQGQISMLLVFDSQTIARRVPDALEVIFALLESKHCGGGNHL
ncbi:hypothetical protein E8E12_005390 [Didymella heteroderae]|uniref:Uncharacterized protein n=1 Tax=Didymella heteroderae TaxID=1769908 RepID=A0A9P4WMU6_9PLEO|nr:hypothetical protein E8E12_005390 [Didymella heteroderae]